MSKEPTKKLTSLPSEFGDVFDVIENGAAKHGRDSWLHTNVFAFNKRMGSMFRHQMKVAGLWDSKDPEVQYAMDVLLGALHESTFKNNNLLDDDSSLSHFLHSACNALMFHVVISRGILKEDE